MSAPIIPLGEATEILSGFAFNAKYFNKEKGIPVIRIRDVKRGYSDTKYDGPFDPSYLVSDGDLLIGMDGEFNISPWSGGEALLNQRVCKISAKDSKKLDERYLLHFLPKQLKHIEDRTPFVTVKHLSVKTIRSIELPLPSLPEQRRITGTLDAADALCRKDQELLRKYDDLSQSMFYEMFGDLVTNTLGWPEEPFKNCGSLDRGVSKHRPRNAPELLGGPYPLIQTGDVANCDGFIKHHNQTYSEFGLKQSKLWKSGTLCITIAANIAKTGVLTFPACFPDSVVGFIPNASVTINYIRFWMMSMQAILERDAPESAQKNINLEILRNLSVPVAPIELQRQFEERLSSVIGAKNRAVESAALSEQLLQSTLTQYFA